MKALIVDDEKIIRMGMRQAVPWDAIGIHQVFTAESGDEALKIFRREKNDIVITDIRMYQMTGLTLIAEIKKIREDVRVIVLTGYDDFDYARECLRMQVQDFLLKPVDENILIESIKKQIRMLNDSREKAEEEHHMRRIFGTSEQAELELHMRKLLESSDKAKYADAFKTKYSWLGARKLKVFLLIPSVCSYGIRKGETQSLSLLTIKNLLIGYIDARRKGITFEDATGKIVMVLFEGEKSDELETSIITVAKLIKEECRVKLKVIAGSTVHGFEEIYISYNDATYLLEKEKDEYKTLISYKESKGQLDMFREVYAELRAKMNENIGNTEKVLRIFSAFCGATDSYNITDQYVRKCCFDIASSVYFSYVVESGENADSKLNVLLAALLSSGRRENYEITKTFLEELLRVEEEEAHVLAAQIKRYIDEHLTKDITVASIAAYFYLSPNYFSRLFKRITNEGCNEYIVRKRMKRAECLLDTTNMKIGHIAQEVGYRDTNYFSLAFKKHSGLSPGQYREKKRVNR
jgi:two-component system response regulator YesN